MIDAPVKPLPYTPEKVVEVIESFEHDEFGYFLEHDPELQMAYGACLQAAGIEWTDEQVAEAAFRHQYGDNIDDLMQAWRFQQHLLNPADPEHQRAAAVHIAALKWQRQQASNPRHTY